MTEHEAVSGPSNKEFFIKVAQAAINVALLNLEPFWQTRNLVEVASILTSASLDPGIDPTNLVQEALRLQTEQPYSRVPSDYVLLEASARAVAGDLSGARARTSAYSKLAEKNSYQLVDLHLANAKLAAKSGENPHPDLENAWKAARTDNTLKLLHRLQTAKTAFDCGLDPQSYLNKIVAKSLEKSTQSALDMNNLTEVAAALAYCNLLDQAVDILKNYHRPARSSNIPMLETITVAKKLISAGRVEDAEMLSLNSPELYLKASIAIAILQSSNATEEQLASSATTALLALGPTRWGLSYDSEIFAQFCQLVDQDPMANTPPHITAALASNSFGINEDSAEVYANFAKVQASQGVDPQETFELAFKAADKIVGTKPNKGSNMDVYRYFMALIDIAKQSARAGQTQAFNEALTRISDIGNYNFVSYPHAVMDLNKPFVIEQTALQLAHLATELNLQAA